MDEIAQLPTASGRQSSASATVWPPGVPALAPRTVPASIWFKFEGLEFAARLEDRDEDYVQIAPGFTLGEESRDELTLLRTMNEVQASTKVVKIAVSPRIDFVEFEMESFWTGGRPA